MFQVRAVVRIRSNSLKCLIPAILAVSGLLSHAKHSFKQPRLIIPDAMDTCHAGTVISMENVQANALGSLCRLAARNITSLRR